MKEIWLIWSGTATLHHRLSPIQGQARIAFLRVYPAVLSCVTVFSFCLFIFEPHWAGEGQWASVLLWPRAATLEESRSPGQVCSRDRARDDCFDVKASCLEKSCRKVFCLLFLLKYNQWRTVAVLESLIMCVGTALEGTVTRDNLGVFYVL